MSDIVIARFYENKQQEAFLRCMEEYGRAMLSWNLVIDTARACIIHQLKTDKLKAKGDKAVIGQIEKRINGYWKSRDDNRVIDGLKRVCKEDILTPWIEGEKNTSHEFKWARNLIAHRILEMFDMLRHKRDGNFNSDDVDIDVAEEACRLIRMFRKEVDRREAKLRRLWEQIDNQYEKAKSTAPDSAE